MTILKRLYQQPLVMRPASGLDQPNTLATSSDHVVKLSGTRYLLRPKTLLHHNTVIIGSQITSTDLLPVVVLKSDQLSIETLCKTIQSFAAIDDVFCADFLSTTLVLQSPVLSGTILESLQIELTAREVLPGHIWPLQTIIQMPLTGWDDIPVGPYIMYRDQLFEVWRLYDDYLSAFAMSAQATEEDPYKFRVVDITSEDGYWKTVAVPSRLYSQRSSRRPLAGLRITVKDVYKLKGIKSSLNVRSYLNTYGPDTETSAYAKQLIDLGAIVIGKTKTTAFASSEKEPEYWIDFQCPFNPRGDGYQVPMGSTTGGAACLAGYDWLDCSLGTDTYGSIRWPAAAQGLYGLRTTTGAAVPMDGVFHQSIPFDTLGMLLRNLNTFHLLATSTFAKQISRTEKLPTRIICPTDWDCQWSKAQIDAVDDMASALESLLGVRSEKLSFADVWDKSPPSEANGKSFQQYFHKTGYNVFYHDAYHTWDSFRADHFEKFKTNVVVGPHMRYVWDLGAEVTPEERQDGMDELVVFKRWMTEQFFGRDKNGASPIIILPQGSTEPEYRDERSDSLHPRLGVDADTVGSWLGVPQLVLPVGMYPYESRLSGRREYLPLCVSLGGARDSDIMLIQLALACFKQEGLPTSLQAGRNMLDVTEQPHLVYSDSGSNR